MAIVTFKMDEVAKLAAELAAATEFGATEDDIFNGANYPGGKPLDKNGLTEQQAKRKNESWWPCASKMTPGVVGPKLILVSDDGIYLITNAKAPGTPRSRGAVAYANGCDPHTDQDCYDKQKTIFGCDDGSVAFPAEWFDVAKQRGNKSFRIKLLKRSIQLA